MYFPLFVGVLCLSLFCYALLCVHSGFVIILKRKRKFVAFGIFVLQSFFYYKCSVVFPTVPWVGLQYVIVVFHDHTPLGMVLDCIDF